MCRFLCLFCCTNTCIHAQHRNDWTLTCALCCALHSLKRLHFEFEAVSLLSHLLDDFNGKSLSAVATTLIQQCMELAWMSMTQRCRTKDLTEGDQACWPIATGWATTAIGQQPWRMWTLNHPKANSENQSNQPWLQSQPFQPLYPATKWLKSCNQCGNRN